MAEKITNYLIQETEVCERIRGLNHSPHKLPEGIYRVTSTSDEGVDGAYHVTPSHTVRIKVLPDYLATITIIGLEEHKKEVETKLEKFLGFQLKEKGR